MYLKTLTLRGFKSFASATTLRLEPGITAVVGPNGSGKSNVVDALTWVMGEQGAKNLRGGQMSDVIFAGAGSRPALGRAEVSLTIDNSDGALPIDYTEVTVTRTLFRGGGSEYQINGTPCRLLDVQELLSDTGLGRQMHVIVGQGRLDAVLQATPEERRGFIEEAAGVLKHRRRKERALRKLDSMAGDLARLKDLTAELHRQLGPLARQAAAARRAQVIQAEVRDATARLLADDVVQVQALIEAGQEDRAQREQARLRTQASVDQARQRLAELSAEQTSHAARLAAATRRWEELSQSAQSFTALAQVAAERARGLAQDPPVKQGSDPEELERRAEAAATQEAELAQAVADAEASLTAATAGRQEAEAGEEEARRELEVLTRTVAERREQIARAGGRVASARSRYEACLAALEQAEGSLAQARDRQEAAQEALRSHEAAHAPRLAPADAATVAGAGKGTGEVAGGPGDLDALTPAAAQAAHERAAARLAQVREQAAQAADARREAASARASWTSRRDTLALSLQAQDSTAELARAGEAGVVGLLAEQLRIAPGWENAIAALLGERASAALVQDEATARLLLEEQGPGSGSLRLVIPGGSGGGLQEDGGPAGEVGSRQPQDPETAAGSGDSRELEDAGASGAQRARGLVHGQGSHRSGVERLLDSLLAGTWVADDLEAAWRLRQTVPDAVVATRTGQVLTPVWASSSGESTSVLELASAYQEAATQAAQAVEAEQEAQTRLDQACCLEGTAAREVARALEVLREADARAAKVAQEEARLAAAVAAAADERERAERVRQRAAEEVTQRRTELAAASAALAELEESGRRASRPKPGASDGQGAPGDRQPAGSTPLTDLEEQAVLARTRCDTLTEQARQARARETEARLSLRTAQERERQSRGRAQSLREAARREREARAAAERAHRRRAQALALAQTVQGQAAMVADVIGGWAERAQRERVDLEAERARAVEAAAGVREQVDELTRQLAELTDAAHRDDVAGAEQRMRLEALAERAMSELGLDLDALVEEFGPHMLVPVLGEDEPGGQGGSATPATSSGPKPAVDQGEETGAEPESTGPEPEAGATSRRAGVPYQRAEQTGRLARAKRDLARLGKVNPLALEEHAALSERHRFLSEQLADLTASRADLLRIVEQIDARVLEVFTSAWEDTAREFEAVFARLFPGGQGRLELTDPEDMLTTGIEIHARPAGKKVTRLSLLSGGERSLAAVALLIAIFKARPSPFYVMDEVEAALDDTNLGRLLEIFTELRASSQLIVITHQKRTMEVADALYGVSMREGVTQVVSQRLARSEADTISTPV